MSRDSVGAVKLFGSLSFEGDASFDVYCNQTTNKSTWILTEPNTQEVKAVYVSMNVSGDEYGYGAVWYLTRMMTVMCSLQTKCIMSSGMTGSSSGQYTNGNTLLEFKSLGRRYVSITLNDSGMSLSVRKAQVKIPKIPTLEPILDRSTYAALVANLGLKTAEQLFAKFPDRFDWYRTVRKDGTIIYRKRYITIKTEQQFYDYMESLCAEAQCRYDHNLEPLDIGLDTESTGLNCVGLSHSNKLLDKCVAIPISFEEDTGAVIFTRMRYFDNVDMGIIKQVFEPLFSRPKDLGDRLIEIEINGRTYRFSRNTLNVTGHNVTFDTDVFAVDDIDVYFDDDTMQLGFNLATDWSKGKNGLKDWTRRFFNHDTVELDELYGTMHKDKYAFLQDEELAKLYGCADGDYSIKVLKKLRALTEPSLYQQYKKYDMFLLKMNSMMEMYGIHIDEDAVRSEGLAVEQDLEDIREFIYHYAYRARGKVIKERINEVIEALANKQDISSKDIVRIQQYRTEIEESEESKTFRFPFTANNNKQLVFDILRYPIIARTDKGVPKLDKFVLKKLAEEELATPSDFLLEDVVSKGTLDEDGKPAILIDKKKFNSKKYPLAYVYKKYGELSKEFTAYYKPILQHNMESKMFHKFRTAQAATRRITNPGQTMKGSLKKYCTAPRGMLSLCWDISQVEYRHMASMAYIELKAVMKKKYPNDWEQRLADTNIAKICESMCNPENDYHIETASAMTGTLAHLVTHDVRSQYKNIGFGIPYGLGLRKMCEKIFGKITSENLGLTKDLLKTYKTKQSAIIDLLERARDSAFVPYEGNEEFRKIMGIGESKIGIVRNFVGFYRMFILDKLTQGVCASIRRKAGNCVIQGGAAEIFRRMLYRFYQGCVAAGIDDKVHWYMTVHDELDMHFDEDTDVIQLIEIIYNNCILKYKDHIPYFVGIGVGTNWHEAKNDGSELPILMVERMIKAYHEDGFRIPSDGNQHKYLLELKRHYMSDRIYECIRDIMSTSENPSHLDIDKIDKEFTNYTVRSYLEVFLTKEVINRYGGKHKVPLKESIRCWLGARSAYGDVKTFTDMTFEPKTDIFYEPVIDIDIDSVNFVDLSDDIAVEDLALDINLQDDEDIEVQLREDVWFDSDEMFNPSKEVEVDENYTYFGNSNETNNGYQEWYEDEDYEENDSPTSAYDVYTSKKYNRKHIFKSSDDVYSVMTKGTKFDASSVELYKALKKELSAGTKTIIIIGTSTKILKNVSVNDTFLDNLDKLIEN